MGVASLRPVVEDACFASAAPSWSRFTLPRVAPVGVRLRMLNRIVTNIYDEALRPLDLKVSQMNVLVAAAKLRTARPNGKCFPE